MALAIVESENLLRSLMSPDNIIRGQAENMFQELKKSPDTCLLTLMQMILSPAADDVRSLSTVLVRRVLIKDKVSLWPQVAEATKQNVKLGLMNCLNSEVNSSIRRKVCDTAGELASGILEDGQWNELLPAMFQWVESNNSHQRESALRIFGMVADYIASSMRDHFGMLREIFEKSLIGPQNDGNLRICALRSFGMLLLQIEQVSAQEEFQPLLSPVLQAVHSMFSNEEWEQSQEGLEILIDLIETFPSFFKPVFKNYFQAMLYVTRETTLPDSPRQLALEFLVCMAEKSPAMCRKIPGNAFVTSTIPIIFQMMLEIEEDEHWNDGVDEDQDEIANSDVGMEALDRIVGALGHKKSLPVAFSIIEQFLSNSDWKFRHAALMGLSQILEVVPNTKDRLQPIAHQIISYMGDSHPRVRYAAINALGQISTDHGPLFQKLFHRQIIPALMSCMEDTANPRVQSHSAAALINFIDMCNPKVLEPYLEQLLGRLFILLRDGKRIVQEQSITAIASIADCAEHLFVRFYDTFMPILKSALILYSDKESRLLRGKALECISLIGVAVGKEKFGPDAVEVMNFMMNEQSSSMDSDDPQRSYILQAWARICKCLGSDFFPYLHVVMPSLIEAATQQAEFELDHFPDEEDEDMEIAQVNDRCVAIRTSVLEDKATACHIISCMIADLQEAFFPFVEQVTKILAPLITESVHDDIRSAAISAMPNLVLCVSRSTLDGEPVKQLLEFALGRLVQSLQSEPELELIMTTIQAIKMCVENASKMKDSTRPGAVLNQPQLVQIVEALLVVLGESFQRRAVKRADNEIEEDEEDEEDEDDTTESELQFVWADCIGGLVKTHKEEFFPVFQSLMLDKVLELVQPYCLVNDRKLAVFIIDDFIEHSGAACLSLFDKFLPNLFQCLGTDCPSLTQAAAYGIGIAARVGGVAFRPYCSDALKALTDIVCQPDCRSENNETASDNAVSALGLLLEHHSDMIDCATIYPQWLSYIPLRADAEESMAVTRRLCNMIERKDVHLLGPNGQNIPQIIRALTDVLLLTNGNDPITSVIISQLRGMRSSLSNETLHCVWASLSREQQGKLHSIIT